MDPETLVKSVGSYMDSLESITNWLIVIMLLNGWNGFTGHGDFEVLGAKITRRHTATILLAIYCFALAALVLQLARLHEALRYIPDTHFNGAATAVVTHAWLLNPFSYIGNDLLQILFGAFTFGLWPIIWWVGLFSIRTAHPDQNNRLQNGLLAYYLIASGLILILIVFIYTSISRQNYGLSYWLSVCSKLLGVAVGGYVGYRLFTKALSGMRKPKGNELINDN